MFERHTISTCFIEYILVCALVKTFGIVFFIISVFCLSTTLESYLIATMHVGNAHNITDMGKCTWFQESMTFNFTNEHVIYFSLLKAIMTCNIFFYDFLNLNKVLSSLFLRTVDAHKLNGMMMICPIHKLRNILREGIIWSNKEFSPKQRYLSPEWGGSWSSGEGFFCEGLLYFLSVTVWAICASPLFYGYFLCIDIKSLCLNQGFYNFWSDVCNKFSYFNIL